MTFKTEPRINANGGEPPFFNRLTPASRSSRMEPELLLIGCLTQHNYADRLLALLMLS